MNICLFTLASVGGAKIDHVPFANEGGGSYINPIGFALPISSLYRGVSYI